MSSPVEVFPPTEDFSVKQGDTLEPLEVAALDALGNVVKLDGIGATAVFDMRPENGSAVSLSKTATIVPDPTFTADYTTATFTAAAHGLVNGAPVMVTAQTALPAGLNEQTVFYVVNATTNTFQLSKAPNGTVVTFTDNGTGTLTLTCGRVRFDWQDGDTDIAGNYWGEFVVTFSGGKKLSFPNRKHIYITVWKKSG